jgi:lysozyme family protein
MSDLFAAADVIVAGAEGAHANDARDPGGDTWFGIARAAHPDIPWPPSWDQAQAIRRAEYFDKHRCGEMPWRWALAIYDGAINQGSVIRWAQLALKTVEDGQVGPGTLAAMAKSSDDEFRAFLALRIEHYAGDAGFPVFGHGWVKRVIAIAQAAEHAA